MYLKENKLNSGKPRLAGGELQKRPSAAFPSAFVVAAYTGSTPHFSGFREPCICAFLTSLEKNFFNS